MQRAFFRARRVRNSLQSARFVQLKEALKPLKNATAPSCNALILCMPTENLLRLQQFQFASSAIRRRVLDAILSFHTESALQQMCTLLRDQEHPACSLVGSLLEPLFSAALRRGGVFEIRSLRSAAAATPLPASRLSPKSTTRTVAKRLRVAKKLTQRPDATPPSASPYRYLWLRRQGQQLTAQLLLELPADEIKATATSKDVLATEPETADIFHDVKDVPDRPNGRLLTSSSKINAAFDALLKRGGPELWNLLFQYTVSLHHKISLKDLDNVLKVLSAGTVHFFFVLPNRHLFDNVLLQPYKLSRCVHGNTSQCVQCAANDDRIEQFALLCEVKGWEDLTYDPVLSATFARPEPDLYDLEATDSKSNEDDGDHEDGDLGLQQDMEVDSEVTPADAATAAGSNPGVAAASRVVAGSLLADSTFPVITAASASFHSTGSDDRARIGADHELMRE